jgi:hypothetical protein
VENIGYTVSHNLNTQDFTYALRDGNNFIQANVEVVDSNRVLVTCGTAIPEVTMTITG